MFYSYQASFTHNTLLKHVEMCTAATHLSHTLHLVKPVEIFYNFHTSFIYTLHYSEAFSNSLQLIQIFHIHYIIVKPVKTFTAATHLSNTLHYSEACWDGLQLPHIFHINITIEKPVERFYSCQTSFTFYKHHYSEACWDVLQLPHIFQIHYTIVKPVEMFYSCHTSLKYTTL